MTDGTLQQFIQQIEAVNRDMKSLSLDRSEIFKAAKQQGYDPKVVRRVIAERARSAAERAEAEEMFRLYWESVEQRELPLLRESLSSLSDQVTL
jgi:uncharacterized protein (UPF0335 family)